MGGIPRREIEAALVRKGFIARKGDHRFYCLTVDGKETSVRTKISTGTGYDVYGDALLGKIRQQLHLPSRKHLKDFVDCPLTYDDYLDLLQEQGTLDIPHSV